MLRSKLTYCIFGAAFAIGSAVVSPAFAGLFENDMGGTAAPTQNVPSSTASPAMVFESFTTPGINPKYTLDTLMLELQSGTTLGSVVITLYPDAAGTGITTPSAPGSAPITTLGTVSDALIKNTFGSGVPGILNLANVQYATGANSLIKNSVYWIGIQTIGAGVGANSVKLSEVTGSGSPGGVIDQYITALSTGPVADMCTANDFTSCQNFITNSETLNALPMLTAQAPEPATLAVLGSALTGLGLIRRRRAKKATQAS